MNPLNHELGRLSQFSVVKFTFFLLEITEDILKSVFCTMKVNGVQNNAVTFIESHCNKRLWKMCQGYFVSPMKAQNNTGPHCDSVDNITQTHLSTYLVLCSTEEFGTTSRRQNDDTLVSYHFKSAEVRFIVIL